MSRPKTIGLKLDKIRIDGGTQSRCETDQSHIEDLRDAYGNKSAGATVPPIVCFFDGTDYWLADGFHRFHAMRAEGIKQAAVDVIKGTQRDATLYAAAANAGHGLKRTNSDKRRAVKMLIADKEWRKWSDRKIAEHCGVSHPFVAAIRKEAVTVTTQKTKSLPPPPDNPPPPDDVPPPPDDDQDQAETEEEPSPDESGAGADRAGFPIPDRLRTAFENRELRELADSLLRVRHRTEALAETNAGAKLNTNRIGIDIENARKAILFAEPFAVCPLCAAGRGRDPQCRACGATGWLTREQWASVPEEMKK